MTKLSETQRKLLKSVVMNRDPERLGEFKMLLESGQCAVSLEARAYLAELVTDEFIATGRQPNDEPNERGLLLEELTDALRPYADD